MEDGAGRGGWGARKAWSLGALPLGESPSRPAPNTRKPRGRSKEMVSKVGRTPGCVGGVGGSPVSSEVPLREGSSKNA